MKPGDMVADSHHQIDPFLKWRDRGWELVSVLAVRVEGSTEMVLNAIRTAGVDATYTNKMVLIVSTWSEADAEYAKGVYSYDDRTFGIAKYVHRFPSGR